MQLSLLFKRNIICLTLFRMSLFGAAHGWWGEGGKKAPLPKICHTHPAMMKLGTLIPNLKKIQKLYKSRDTLLDFCWHQHFLPEISKFCLVKCRYRLYFDTLFLILLSFFQSWKFSLINMVTILMMSAKNGYSRLS